MGVMDVELGAFKVLVLILILLWLCQYVGFSVYSSFFEKKTKTNQSFSLVP